ncbi:MAG TPA: PstS family phosphate ABC transporter substrate-binding protein [Micromonosporaceae bacterium]|nr:PstS family phosphate ABC transporter substrate-binding protein [Micromonosporaceae bacterium]
MNRNALSRPTAAGAALVALALAGTAALAGCGGSDNGAAGGLAGPVLVDGSSTVAPLSKAAADIYREEEPRVNITVGTSGTGGGFEKFCKGETDVSNASRPIKGSEKAACAAANIAYTELVVANDALTVVVNKANTWAECLTIAQLKKVWDQGSKVRGWKEVDPSFPDQRLDLFGPGTDSGTFDFFTAAVNGQEDRSRADYTASENDNVLVQGVAGSTGGLGYFGYTYFEENADKLKAVKVDGGSGCVAPSVAAAQDGSYRPLSRPLYIYVSNQAMTGKPQVRSFVEFYAAHIDEIVEEARYVPLTAAQKAELGAALVKAKG